jgi:TatD DNase family protein
MGGVIHCFSYSVEMAKEYLDMGLYLGIGGTLTFKNARKIKDVVAYMPIEQMVIETDAPYLSPEPLRGKRNSSLNLTYVVNEIASIKNMAPREVIEITKQNAMKLYQINC